MRKPRSKTVILLIVVFVWSALKGTERIVTGSSDADRILFDQVGMGSLATLGLFVTLGLDVAAIWYLVKPRRIGWHIALTAIGIPAALTTAGLLIGRAHPDALRAAMIVSREARGLPVREGAIELAMDPINSLLLVAGSLAISALLAFLVVWNRSYFDPSRPSTSSLQPTTGAGA